MQIRQMHAARANHYNRALSSLGRRAPARGAHFVSRAAVPSVHALRPGGERLRC